PLAAAHIHAGDHPAVEFGRQAVYDVNDVRLLLLRVEHPDFLTADEQRTRISDLSPALAVEGSLVKEDLELPFIPLPERANGADAGVGHLGRIIADEFRVLARTDFLPLAASGHVHTEARRRTGAVPLLAHECIIAF